KDKAYDHTNQLQIQRKRVYDVGALVLMNVCPPRALASPDHHLRRDPQRPLANRSAPTICSSPTRFGPAQAWVGMNMWTPSFMDARVLPSRLRRRPWAMSKRTANTLQHRLRRSNWPRMHTDAHR